MKNPNHEQNNEPKNQDLKVEQIGDYLTGKKIALCVSGGIGAIETPKIARQIRRMGGDVHVYVTKEAFKFIGEAALEWGSEHPVVSELSGMAEHICLENLVLVAPATLNTIDKIRAGIADNPVTTLVASALGMKKPIYLTPTMHESLYDNPFFQENLEKLKGYVQIIEPRISEGKKKMPSVDEIAAKVARELSESELKGKKILVTAGPTPAKIDDVRMITNVFKGTLGVLIAKEAYLRGADVTLLLGRTGISVPSYIKTKFHSDYFEYQENVHSELEKGYDVGIFSAAVADYIPEKILPGKTPSGGAITSIPLVQSKKIISEVREKFPKLYMVTFKYEDDSRTKEKLLEIANARIARGYQLVVANRAQDMKDSHNAYIVGREGVIAQPTSKQEIAKILMDKLEERI